MPVSVTSKKLPPPVLDVANGHAAQNAAAAAAAVVAAAPAGVWGLIAIPLPVGPPPNPAPPGVQSLVAIVSAPAILQNPVVQTSVPGQAGPSSSTLAAGINEVNEEFGGYFKRKRDGPHLKRSSSVTSCSSIMFRGWDMTKYNGNLFW